MAMSAKFGVIALLLSMALAAGQSPALAESRLADACIYNNADAMRAALKAGENPNGGGGDSVSDIPLLICAECSSPELAAMLLDAGARINVRRSETAPTPLYNAVKGGRDAMVRLLLSRGAKPNLRYSSGVSLLHYAAQYQSAIFYQLLDAGADIYARDDEGRSVLHYAVSNPNSSPARTLLAAGLDPNLADYNGDTPLHSKDLRPRLVAAFAAAGADLDKENKAGLSPVEMARSPDVLQAFAEAGACVVNPELGRVRGFNLGYSGRSRIRFVWAMPWPGSVLVQPNPLKAMVLAQISPENGFGADASAIPGFSEQFRFVDEQEKPLPGTYYAIFGPHGMLVIGYSDKDGLGARIFTPESMKVDASFIYNPEEEVLALLQEAHAARSTPLYGERICFVQPQTRQLVAGYPYFLLAPGGYALAGQSDELGCTADFFPPTGRDFEVYGGEDAWLMEVLQKEN